MTYEQAAQQIMASDGVDRIWFGDPDVWHGIFALKNGHNDKHPIAQWQAVYSALKKSKKFKVRGYIQAPGFSTGREMAHPVFELNSPP